MDLEFCLLDVDVFPQVGRGLTVAYKGTGRGRRQGARLPTGVSGRRGAARAGARSAAAGARRFRIPSGVSRRRGRARVAVGTR